MKIDNHSRYLVDLGEFQLLFKLFLPLYFIIPREMLSLAITVSRLFFPHFVTIIRLLFLIIILLTI